jgi:hypothetical protein
MQEVSIAILLLHRLAQHSRNHSSVALTAIDICRQQRLPLSEANLTRQRPTGAALFDPNSVLPVTGWRGRVHPGGLVFAGMLDGTPLALDDQTLEEQWRFNVGTDINAAR